MDFGTWFAFVMVVGALLIVPGPTVLMVTSLSLRHGWRSLAYVVPGIALADVIFIAVALATSSALFKVSPVIYWVMSIAGLIYVLYLARSLWQAGPTHIGDGQPEVARSIGFGLMTKAFLVTITNPKGFVFVFGIIPSILSKDQINPLSSLILILTFLTMSALNASAWGLLANGLLGCLARWPHVGKVSALILLAAIVLAWGFKLSAPQEIAETEAALTLPLTSG